jgi:hypothetical protein
MSTQDSSQKVQRRVVLIGVAASVIAMAVGTGVSVSGNHAELRGQEAETQSLTQQLNESRVREDVAAKKAVEDATGVDSSRTAGDEAIVRDIATTALTWNSGKTFDEARERLRSKYGTKGSTAFFTTFMPEATYNEDEDGQRYYALDATGANSAAGEMEIRLQSAKGDAYRYLALVDTAITSDSVKANDSKPEDVTAHRTTIIEVTVHGDGSISNLEGMAPGGATLVSK